MWITLSPWVQIIFARPFYTKAIIIKSLFNRYGINSFDLNCRCFHFCNLRINDNEMQKLILSIAIILFSSIFVMSDPLEKFSFVLRIVRTEKSKDSNTRYESWSLVDGQLRYEKSHPSGRFKKKPPVKKQKQLSDAEIKSIYKLILSKQILQNIDAPKRSEFKTPYTATSVGWIYSEGSKSFAIEMYDISSELEKDPLYIDFSSLIQLLDSLLK